MLNLDNLIICIYGQLRKVHTTSCTLGMHYQIAPDGCCLDEIAIRGL